eukprot:scaffold2923_cov121-Cylindrotheca_fusiformis.AAC.3
MAGVAATNQPLSLFLGQQLHDMHLTFVQDLFHHILRQGVAFFCSYRSTIGYKSQSIIPLNALAPRTAGSDVRTGKVYACWYIESKKSNTIQLIS